MKKIRVGVVNYLNTKPLLYGLERHPVKHRIEIVASYPSRLATMLKNNEIDIGLIPVAAIPEIKDAQVIGNFCIGAEGEIGSVCLFSEVPMNEVARVYLDYQSRSSVALLQWLMKEYWGISPEIIHARDESFLGEIKGKTAGLVIGDRALEQRRISTFIFDLGSEWKAITGLPFVFAAWVSKESLPEDFVKMFDEANAIGLQHIEEIVSETPFSGYDLKKYYTLHVSYNLDDRKRQGMRRFLQIINENRDVPVATSP